MPRSTPTCPARSACPRPRGRDAAALRRPGPGPHADLGLRAFGRIDHRGRLSHDGSALVYVDSGIAMPPHGNVPPQAGEDPHGDPRRDAFAHAQRRHFFATGDIVDTRAGQPYWTVECRGPRNPQACGDGFQPW